MNRAGDETNPAGWSPADVGSFHHSELGLRHTEVERLPHRLPFYAGRQT